MPVVEISALLSATRLFAEKPAAESEPFNLIFPFVFNDTLPVMLPPLVKVMSPAASSSVKVSIAGVSVKTVPLLLSSVYTLPFSIYRLFI